MKFHTQYAIVYRGQLDPAMTFGTRVDVDAYVATAVAHGHDPADYGVAHRTITYGEWAETTPAPATVAALADGAPCNCSSPHCQV